MKWREPHSNLRYHRRHLSTTEAGNLEKIWLMFWQRIEWMTWKEVRPAMASTGATCRCARTEEKSVIFILEDKSNCVLFHCHWLRKEYSGA